MRECELCDERGEERKGERDGERVRVAQQCASNPRKCGAQVLTHVCKDIKASTAGRKRNR